MTNPRSSSRWIAPLLFHLACATSPGATQPSKSLYERLGGKDAITAVVGDFVAKLAADARINARFANADIPRLKTLLIEQICEASGGPCHYSGKDMKTVHTGMGLGDADFNALVEDLQASLAHLNVPAKEQSDLLGALAGMKPDIVENPTSPAKAIASRPTPGQQDAVSERAQAIREAASLLEKAGEAKKRGNRSLGEQLFSAAELLVGGSALEPLASLFREGAPPRVTTAPRQMTPSATPQPAIAGNSDEESPDPKPPRGSLAGTVTFEGRTAGDSRAVVTLEPASGKFRHPTPRQRTIEQRNRDFAPKLLVVPRGSTVTFPNYDTIYHNVFSRSESKPFDLGYYKNGQAREILLDKEGVVHLGCNLHANMSAYIVVVDAPHYVVTDGKGHFGFRSLEPGRYRLRVYSEQAAETLVKTVEIKAGKNTVTLTVAASAKAPPALDKFGAPREGASR